MDTQPETPLSPVAPPTSRALHPDRRRLCNLSVLAAGLALLMGLVYAAQRVALEATYGTGPLPAGSALVFAATMLCGIGALLSVVWAVLRACDQSPALILGTEGLALLDRMPLSLAARPVILSWTEIAELRMDTGFGGGGILSLATRDGAVHRIGARALEITGTALIEACLRRAKARGMTVTQTRQAKRPWPRQVWRLQAA